MTVSSTAFLKIQTGMKDTEKSDSYFAEYHGAVRYSTHVIMDKQCLT